MKDLCVHQILELQFWSRFWKCAIFRQNLGVMRSHCENSLIVSPYYYKINVDEFNVRCRYHSLDIRFTMILRQISLCTSTKTNKCTDIISSLLIG